MAVVRDIESADILIGNDLFAKFPDITDILRETGKASDTLINPDKSDICVNPVVEAHGMKGSLSDSDARAGRSETEQVENIPSILITTRRKNYGPRSINGVIGKQSLPVSVETSDRQGADTSCMASSDNAPVKGAENVINSEEEGLITETNRHPAGVKEDELNLIGESLDRQGAGISIETSANIDNSPGVGIEPVINSTPKELITEKNQCSPGVMDESSSVEPTEKNVPRTCRT